MASGVAKGLRDDLFKFVPSNRKLPTMAALSLLSNDRLEGVPPPPRVLRQPNSLSSRVQDLFASSLPLVEKRNDLLQRP
ncbi:hypothetical protein AVEN_224762-1 [Araneus ventricosus]|uniref:Uncharacterized protein n=1 Tax=Araneus ventricosus TaxID=182803 RepID=A0A4Y2GUB7_ARAVE|nr:hypothetical protein AVEN_224762-1 [Araneus ventricosus]